MDAHARTITRMRPSLACVPCRRKKVCHTMHHGSCEKQVQEPGDAVWRSASFSNREPSNQEPISLFVSIEGMEQDTDSGNGWHPWHR